jgi:hypothetical protein
LRWRPDVAAAAAAVLLSAALCGLAAAAPPDAQNRDRLDATVRYLQNAQNPDGGFGSAAGAPSNADFSAWVAYALAAAGINPQDQAKPGGTDAYAYLAEETAGLSVTTDWERVLLVAIAAGTPPHDFGGTDPVARILERRLPDGSFPHDAGGTAGGVNDTAFAVLALCRVPDPAAQAAIPGAVDWLISVQDPKTGGWGHTPGGATVGVDMTGAVIQALNAAGRRGTEAERRGFDYLRSLQNDDGGFPQASWVKASNVASTAWAVQAMWSAGIDPRAWERAGGDPLDYMAHLQQPDGSVRYMDGDDSNRLWMTAQVAPAFAGQANPPTPAPRSKPPDPIPSVSATPAGAPAAGEGQGGLAGRQSGGVIAGGGGEGAPLFSRPRPQSRGRTAGGARELDPRRARRAPVAPTPVPLATLTATPAPPRRATTAAPTRVARGTRLDGDGDGPGGPGGYANVTGTLVDANAKAAPHALPAAPGLRAAGAGGADDAVAVAIAIALACAALAGATLELRPREAGA